MTSQDKAPIPPGALPDFLLATYGAEVREAVRIWTRYLGNSADSLPAAFGQLDRFPDADNHPAFNFVYGYMYALRDAYLAVTGEDLHDRLADFIRL